MATICMHHVLTSMRGAEHKPGGRTGLLIASGINPLVVRDARKRVSTDQVARLFRNVQVVLDDEFMGFSREFCRIGAFRTMCELVSQCRVLGELLEKAVEFYRLLNRDVQMNVAEQDGRVTFSVRHESEELDPDHFLREFLLVIWHRFPSWYIGKAIRLQETHFSFSQPAHHTELQVMFPSVLSYDQPVNCLVYDASYLDMPLVRSQEEIDRYVANAPADVMTIPGAGNSLENQIQRLVKTESPGVLAFPPVELLADRLGLSPQTLYRRLKASGTSYQKIKDDIRRETAINGLVNQGLSVEKVSEIVGFSEARSFTRAFRHWTGMSPRRYRAMMG